MWRAEDPDRFAAAISRGGIVRNRVELWSAGEFVARVPFSDGSVKDDWVTGIRRSLSLTVPSSRQWWQWMELPRLELRPFRGVRYSKAEVEDCPMGRFPFLPPERSKPEGKDVTVAANDYWEWVSFADFPGAAGSSDGPVLDALSRLIRDAGLPQPILAASLNPFAPGVLFTGTRQQAVSDLASSVGVECYIDREGTPKIVDAPALGASVATLQARSVTVKPHWDKVYNLVSASSSAQGVSFDPIWVSLDWSGHPAHPNRVGWTKTYELKSPTIMTPEQAAVAGAATLAKVASLSRAVTFTCVPDPRLDSSDSVSGVTPDGVEVSQIQSVTTPLTAKGMQTVSTVATRIV